MAQPAPSSSSSSPFPYDVFLSFRGEDTRFGFTGNLYKALNDMGIRTFMDDVELPRGDEITPSLVRAIENSRTAIIVFSKNYASSSFCLDELVNIIACIKDKSRLVLPIFYDVDPSVVRHQRRSYHKALALHEERFKDDMDKVQKWRKALRQAADLSGHHFKLGDGYEYQFIERIIKDVSNKINPTPLHETDYLVGMDSRVQKVMEHLDISSNRVHMVGIHGIGGMGKTTLAWAVYNSIAAHFDSVCFLERVREKSDKNGLNFLQEMLLSKLTGKKDIIFTSVKEGIWEIRKRLHHKKVLLILDDVNASEQLHDLVGEPDWFGPGSRVIITTRDKPLLASHGVESIYDVDELNKREALELLRWKLFKSNVADPSFNDILNRVVAYASGLPLALKVIGSNLSQEERDDWKSALDDYERIPHEDIQKILQVSFDALKVEEKSVFLDIACFYNGYPLRDVEDILRAHHDKCMKRHIGKLVKKSLIKINKDGEVTLHDLIEDMGKEIVRQESPKEPGKRTRLWFHEDIVQVLEGNTGTSNIEIIYVDIPESDVVNWDGNAFKKMTNLKALSIGNSHFSEGPKQFPKSLRVLEWWGFPLRSLPYNFHPTRLAIFRLPYSSLMSLDLTKSLKKMVNLRYLDLRGCNYITEIPDVSGVPNLEEISFQECENLTKIHESIGFLDKLRILDAFGCSSLKSFPPIKLTSLQELHLSYCSCLESFPEILGKMKNITELYLRGTSIKELPFSFRNLTRLQKIELINNFIQMELSSSTVMLPELEQLSIVGCEGLQFSKQEDSEEKVSSNVKLSRLHLRRCKISDEFLRIGLTLFANVKQLDLSDNNFTILPACLMECRFLKKLFLNRCKLLQEIKGIPPNLELFFAIECTSLEELDLTLLPSCTNECRFLRKLILDYCMNLRDIRGIPRNLEFLSAIECISLTSQCASMLMHEALHEDGGKKFRLPGRSIPEWFEHQSKGPPISFWFRNKFPAISLCFHAGAYHFSSSQRLHIKLIINGEKVFPIVEVSPSSWSHKNNYTVILDLKQMDFVETHFEIDWNHVVFFIDIDDFDGKRVSRNPFYIQFGLHMLKQKCRMEDIQFNDPYNHNNSMLLKEKNREDTVVSHVQLMQLQQLNLDSLVLSEQHVGQGLPPSTFHENVNWDSDFVAPSVGF